MLVLSGKTILHLRKRLGEDWADLVLYFDIPRERCKDFTQGRECDGVVAWLRERERLGELSEALAALDRDDLIPLLEAAPGPVLQKATPTWSGSPFPGLRRFNPEDAPIFFGRYREIKGLLRKLADPTNRFIAVLGASGSGKSSLVAAGLIPQLQANAIAGSQDWPWLEFTPGGAEGDPYPTLTARLEHLLKGHGLRESEIVKTLRAEQGYGLIELAEKVLSNRPAQAELLLFVDQFEELFTLTREALRQPFVRLLTTTARSPRMRIVAAMRADFFHRCLDCPGLDRLLREGSYPLGPPGPGALYEMMTGPAAKAGLEFEEGLVERILEDTGSGSGALALLAFALHELYESRKQDGRLTHGAYERFGGVQHAISQRAENTFQCLASAVQAELAHVFRELVQVDERGVATRQRAPLAGAGRLARRRRADRPVCGCPPAGARAGRGRPTGGGSGARGFVSHLAPAETMDPGHRRRSPAAPANRAMGGLLAKPRPPGRTPLARRTGGRGGGHAGTPEATAGGFHRTGTGFPRPSRPRTNAGRTGRADHYSRAARDHRRALGVAGRSPSRRGTARRRLARPRLVRGAGRRSNAG